MKKRNIEFEINATEQKGKIGQTCLMLTDHFTCHDMILIAAFCVKTVGDREGLDKAIELFERALYVSKRVNKTKGN